MQKNLEVARQALAARPL